MAGKDNKSKKVVRAEKSKGFGISDSTWTSHHQLFAHLISAGPTMHSHPGAPKPKKGGK